MSSTRFSAQLRNLQATGAYALDARDSDGLRRATRTLGYELVRVDLSHCATKEALLAAFARALRFPEWFGHNWDAFADCLCDLSWRPAKGYVLLLEHSDALLAHRSDAFATAVAALTDASRSWAEQEVPFWSFVPVSGLAQRRALLAQVGLRAAQ